MMGTRSRRGWLTKESLREGLKEVAAWVTVGMEKHVVTLAPVPSDGPEVWAVRHRVTRPGGSTFTARLSYYSTLTAAREQFKKEASH